MHILYTTDTTGETYNEVEDFESTQTWLEWFLSQPSSQFLCTIGEDFLTDRFNLVGLGKEVSNFENTYEILCDASNDDLLEEETERSAKILYGLIHARYILTTDGLSKMKLKYLQEIFGHCPAFFCNRTALLPCGLSDNKAEHPLTLYCPSCQNIFFQNQNATKGCLDGAYFGKSFPALFFKTYPTLVPATPQKYTPTIFGFELATEQEIEKTNALQ